jgi:hypothetical protein
MRTHPHPQRKRPIPEALRLHNEAQRRDPEDVVSDLRRQVRVAVLWRQDERDLDRWVYLERMAPSAFSMEAVKVTYGGGAYRIRLFGVWDRARRQERYLTQVTFWIHRGFPPTRRALVRMRRE